MKVYVVVGYYYEENDIEIHGIFKDRQKAYELFSSLDYQYSNPNDLLQVVPVDINLEDLQECYSDGRGFVGPQLDEAEDLGGPSEDEVRDAIDFALNNTIGEGRKKKYKSYTGPKRTYKRKKTTW